MRTHGVAANFSYDLVGNVVVLQRNTPVPCADDEGNVASVYPHLANQLGEQLIGGLLHVKPRRIQDGGHLVAEEKDTLGPTRPDVESDHGCRGRVVPFSLTDNVFRFVYLVHCASSLTIRRLACGPPGTIPDVSDRTGLNFPRSIS